MDDPPEYAFLGALAAHQLGGETWRKWEVPLFELLEPRMRCDGSDAVGSWDVLGESGRYGRVHRTALATLVLEVWYRNDRLVGMR